LTGVPEMIVICAIAGAGGGRLSIPIARLSSS
jgi:hypothetical protein